MAETPPITAELRRSDLSQVRTALFRKLPGVGLCLAISVAALAVEEIELHLFGRAWLEAIVLAILIGAVVRTFWTPAGVWMAGIAFSAKTLLEVAIVLLGASLSVSTLAAAGSGLIVGIAAVVTAALFVSYGIGRALGLPHRMAVLISCGNSICGNSAIAAVAPVIGADGKDVAASIAFTAVLGVLVVLGLPLLVPLLKLSDLQYGVLAGLTVYAVPQVLAATAPVAAVSIQIGTLVKLTRVLMLGPVVLALSIASRLQGEAATPAAVRGPGRHLLAVNKLVPWFIVLFLVMAALRSAGAIPQVALTPISKTATYLTVLSMAALGLGVDVRTVARAGGRVIATVTISLIALGAISLGLIRLLGVG